MSPSLSIFFTASLAIFSLVPTIQAQNSTNSTGGSDDLVLDVLLIEDPRVGAAVSLGSQQMVGAVITANPSSTVIRMSCVDPNTDTEVCPYIHAFVPYGPTTWNYHHAAGVLDTTAKCSLTQSTSSAICTQTLVGP